MLCFPNAKINIGLNIVERRNDGFHNIETVFYPIPLSDILEVIKKEKTAGGKAELSITGQTIPGDKDSNLCLRAYDLLDKDFDLPPVHIYLHKIIPMGAGLGGGSSDGAYTLLQLNKLFELNVSANQLSDYASQLGSDCAFFMENKCSLGTGKGNVLERLPVNLLGYYLILIKPPVFVGTAEAYAGIKPQKPLESLVQLMKLPVKDWKDKVSNDFETSVFEKYPVICHVKDELYRHGALYASMTGSGSAVYGIFSEEVNLKSQFEEMFYWGGNL